MADCEAPRLDNGEYDMSSPVGCGRASPSSLDACPFCGQSDVVDPRAPAAAPATKAEAEPEFEAEPEPEAESKVEAEAKPGAKPAKGARASKASSARQSVAPTESEDELKEESASVEPAATREPIAPPVVRVSSEDVRRAKGRRGMTAIETPTLVEHTEPVASEPPNEAPPAETAPVESAEAETGATVADLDAQVARFKRAAATIEVTTAVSFWEQGRALLEIIDRKLWCLVRNEGDGSPVYRSLGEFCSRVLDVSQSTAYDFRAIAASFEREQAERLGFTRMKELVRGQDLPPETFKRMLDRASARTEDGEGFVVSIRELRDEIAAEKRLLQAPPAATTGGPSRVEHDEDGVVVESDDEDDEDDDATPARSGKADRARPAPVEPKTIAISLAETKITVPLLKKGSNVKAAKKLEDGCHGTFVGTNGVKCRVEICIGDDAEICVVLTLDRPR